MGLFSDNAEDRKTFRQQLRETNISHWHEPIHEPVEFNDSISLHIVFREMEVTAVASGIFLAAKFTTHSYRSFTPCLVTLK